MVQKSKSKILRSQRPGRGGIVLSPRDLNFYEAGNAMAGRACIGLNGCVTNQLSEEDGGLNAAELE